MKKVWNSRILFWAVTCSLVVIIAFCVTGTVASRSDIAVQELENYYRVQEKELLRETKEFLREMGFKNSGVTLTRVVDGEGHREYTFTIHHGKIDKMSEAERAELGKLLLTKAVLDENCTFYHEFLMYE